MSARNRSLEVLEYLTGHYEVISPELKRAYISLGFWLSKAQGNSDIRIEGMRFTARLGQKSIDLFPERLDVSRDRLGMRLKSDALPEGWLAECEITISYGKQYRCYPFKGIPDISASLRPTSVRPSDQGLEAASP